MERTSSNSCPMEGLVGKIYKRIVMICRNPNHLNNKPVNPTSNNSQLTLQKHTYSVKHVTAALEDRKHQSLMHNGNQDEEGFIPINFDYSSKPLMSNEKPTLKLESKKETQADQKTSTIGVKGTQVTAKTKPVDQSPGVDHEDSKKLLRNIEDRFTEYINHTKAKMSSMSIKSEED